MSGVKRFATMLFAVAATLIVAAPSSSQAPPSTEPPPAYLYDLGGGQYTIGHIDRNAGFEQANAVEMEFISGGQLVRLPAFIAEDGAVTTHFSSASIPDEGSNVRVWSQSSSGWLSSSWRSVAISDSSSSSFFGGGGGVPIPRQGGAGGLPAVPVWYDNGDDTWSVGNLMTRPPVGKVDIYFVFDDVHTYIVLMKADGSTQATGVFNTDNNLVAARDGVWNQSNQGITDPNAMHEQYSSKAEVHYGGRVDSVVARNKLNMLLQHVRGKPYSIQGICCQSYVPAYLEALGLPVPSKPYAKPILRPGGNEGREGSPGWTNGHNIASDAGILN